MTVTEAILEVSNVKPHKYNDATLTRWLSELDGKVWEDLYANYPDAPDKPSLPYDAVGSTPVSLLIPFPHEDVYIKYLCAQIDFHNAEFERYNNDMLMFNAQYQAFVDAFTRSHMPEPVYIKGARGTFA